MLRLPASTCGCMLVPGSVERYPERSQESLDIDAGWPVQYNGEELRDRQNRAVNRRERRRE